MKRIYSLLTIVAVLIIVTANINAQISGTVFRDLPVTGTSQNVYGVKEANEPGVEGVTVTVYPGGTSTTTAADGTYSISATGAVRIEFSGWPSYLKESADGGGVNSSVQFVVAPSSNINFGLYNPADFSQVNPRISTSVLYEGEYTGAANGKYGHLSVPIEATGHHFQSNGNPTGAFQGTTIANFGQIGSTYGLAYQVTKKILYLGAYQKRFSGYGSNGPDAIYMLDVINNTVVGVIELDVLTGVNGSTGTDPHDFTTTSNGEILDLGVNNSSFDGVGKIGFGDIEISEDYNTLFAVNLYDRKIYVIDISDGNVASASILKIWDAPSPCGGGTVSRPFALGVKDGKLFLGLTCEDASNAYVYSTDIDITNSAPVFNMELTIPLNYTRQPILDSGTYSGSGPDDMWHAWVNDPTNISPLPETNSSHEIWYPQPMFTDIEFDAKGLILGFRDRFGDQTGTNLPLYMNSGLKWGTAGGDIIRACGTPGSYSLESGVLGGGVCDASTGKNNSGVNGYEFYAWDLWALDGSPDPSGNGGNSGFHWETTQGGLVQLQGSEDVVTTDMDPQSDYSGGVLRLRNDGVREGGGNQSFYSLYETGDYGSGGSPDALTYGKANGLGDLELLSDPAPIEIGNLVWEDTDGDGVQDPGESGISGVTVELKQGGTTIATAITDANGNYIFSNDPNGTTTASHIYNITQLIPGMDYTLTVPTTSGSNSLTTKDSGEGSNPDLNDSDVDTGTGEIQVLASNIPVTGANNHSFDIGYMLDVDEYCLDYRFEDCDGNATTVEHNGSGLDGTLVNGAEIKLNEGKIDHGLYTDGTGSGGSASSSTYQMMLIPNDPKTQIVADLTIALWVKPDALGNRMGLVTKDGHNHEFWFTLLENGQLYFRHGDVTALNSNSSISAGQWTHVAVVRDAVNKLIYFFINGVQDGAGQSYAGMDDPVMSTEPVVVGACPPCGYPYKGYIDELKICNYTYSSAQMSNLYNMQNQGKNEDGTDRCPSSCDLNDTGKDNESCNDNNTGSDSSDDYITFDLNPSGTDLGTSYTVSVNNGGTITPTSGVYGSATSFQLQNGSANGTSYTITITDNADANCTITTTVQQNSCSDLCALMDAGKTNETCNDNGTESDAIDDYITFSLDPTGLNLGTSYTVSVNNGGTINPTSGVYGSATSFQLQNGSANGTTYTITITDNADANCTITTTVQQNSCSNTCNLTSAGKTNETCSDNGTASDATDDYITFSLDPTGSNLGTSYMVSVNNGGTITPTSGVYGSATSFQLQNGSADGTTYTITITDNADANCTITTTVQQNSCSDLCALMDAGKTNETCNDNGTESDAIDDYITFSLDPTGLNLGTSYTVSVNNGGTINPTSGVYGSVTSFQLQNGSANGTSYTITITDNADANCTITTTVQQNSCSDLCALTDAGKNNEACNNAGTSGDGADDYISFDLNPAGLNISAGYTVTVDNGGTITPTSGTYGSATSFQLQNGSANGTTYTVTITDNADPNCTITTTVNQNSCSTCTTSATFTTDCDDNGTLPNETDDYFNLVVTGTVTDGTGNYVVKIGTYTSASTASGTSVTITGDGQGGNPMLAADGSSTYTVRIEDAGDSTCFTEYTVGPVDECSECPTPDCLKVQVKKNN